MQLKAAPEPKCLHQLLEVVQQIIHRKVWHILKMTKWLKTEKKAEQQTSFKK